MWSKSGLRVSIRHDQLDLKALQAVSPEEGRCQTVIGGVPVMIVKIIKHQPHSFISWFLPSPSAAVVVEVAFDDWDDLAVVRHIVGSVEVLEPRQP